MGAYEKINSSQAKAIRCVSVSEGDKYLCLCTVNFAGEAVFFIFNLLYIVYYLYI